MKNHKLNGKRDSTKKDQQQLYLATRVLRGVIEEDKRLGKRVTKALKNLDYLLKAGKKILRTELLVCWGATGGYGIVLMTDKKGRAQFGVSCPIEVNFPDIIEGEIWSGATQLPGLIKEALLELQTPEGVKKMLKFGLRS